MVCCRNYRKGITLGFQINTVQINIEYVLEKQTDSMDKNQKNANINLH